MKYLRYVCPRCKIGGAHPSDREAPLCHNCKYEVVMELRETLVKENAMQAKTMIDPQTQFKLDLKEVLAQIESVLISKNRKYGDAALNPNQTFSKCSPIELINVRLDDKLSRIRNRQNDEDEDPELDILGYLLLKQIAKRREVAERKAEFQRLAELNQLPNVTLQPIFRTEEHLPASIQERPEIPSYPEVEPVQTGTKTKEVHRFTKF